MSTLLIPRLLVAAGLLGALLAAARARAPRRPIARRELRRLLAAALALDAVGVVAWVADEALLATLALVVGVVVAALAGWLSRGAFPEDPPDGEPAETPPGPTPGDDVGPVDWERFDRERRGWTGPARRPAAPR